MKEGIYEKRAIMKVGLNGRRKEERKEGRKEGTNEYMKKGRKDYNKRRTKWKE